MRFRDMTTEKSQTTEISGIREKYYRENKSPNQIQFQRRDLVSGR